MRVFLSSFSVFCLLLSSAPAFADQGSGANRVVKKDQSGRTIMLDSGQAYFLSPTGVKRKIRFNGDHRTTDGQIISIQNGSATMKKAPQEPTAPRAVN